MGLVMKNENWEMAWLYTRVFYFEILKLFFVGIVQLFLLVLL